MRARTLLIAGLIAGVASSASHALAQSGSAQGGDEPATWKELVAGKARLQFYGSLRLDMISDDSRPNSSQSPLYVLSEDPNFGPADQGNFEIHPRLSRFGLNLKGPQVAGLAGAVPSGNIEMDFEGGGPESRPNIRIRHAYFKMSWRTLSVLAGQTWDLFAPLIPTVNNDTMLWNAGNLGDRRPQLRLTWEPKAGKGTFSLAGAAALTGAVDSQDLDDNGVRDGEASGRPDAQMRAGYTGPMGSDRKWSVGLSGLYAWQETATPIVVNGAPTHTFRARALNLDVKVPILKWLALQGEAWTGQDLADFRGGIAQSINTDPNSPGFGEEIESRGGWVELGFKIGKSWGIHPGYSIDNPRDRNVPDGATQANAGRTGNRIWSLCNRWQRDPSFLLGFDYLRWITDYKAVESGVDNRIDVYLLYYF